MFAPDLATDRIQDLMREAEAQRSSSSVPAAHIGSRQGIVVGQAANGEGAPASVEPMVRFSRLDPEWAGRRPLQYDVYLEEPFLPGVAPAS